MKFDTTLKSLFRESPTIALRQLAGHTVERWSSVELPSVQNLRTDLLGETRDGGLLQIEIQSNNDPGMPFRMLEYSVAITRLHRRVPIQVLLYVGPEPLRMPSVYEWQYGSARYSVVDLRELDGDALVASPEPGDNVIGLLAKLKDRSRAVRDVIGKLLQLDEDQSTAYARALLILAGLRPGLTAEIEEAMTYEFDEAILDNEVLGPIYRNGMREGIQEGIQEGERTVLRRQLERRFGPLPAWAEDRLTALSAAGLNDLADRILDERTLEELFPEH